MTTDFMRFSALVEAYSREVIEAKVSDMLTRMFGPETAQTLTLAETCRQSISHATARRLLQIGFENRSLDHCETSGEETGIATRDGGRECGRWRS